MLGITKKTDYALIALTHLATAEDGSTVRAREIAERYAIPPDLLAKILQKLAKSGLLVSTPGRTGGYTLARNADEITIGEVLAAVEGTPALAQCLREDASCCEQLEQCNIRHPLARINARVFEMLDAIPVSELVRTRSESSVKVVTTTR